MLSAQLLSAVADGHLSLAMESAAALGLAAACETNARALVEASNGHLVSQGLVPLLQGLGNDDPRLVLGAQAAALLCCASLARHLGCVASLVRGNAFHALVALVAAETRSTPTLPPALLGAACAALGSFAADPTQAAALRSSGCEAQLAALKATLEGAPIDSGQASLLESCTAALAAVERFAPLHAEK